MLVITIILFNWGYLLNFTTGTISVVFRYISFVGPSFKILIMLKKLTYIGRRFKITYTTKDGLGPNKALGLWQGH